ncbi:aspartate--tRNA ligase [Acidimicrobiia bacterium EGI L10123]|uniref:aspartate--tRNA ligase n=1 Tax=Salinilacustrithrix flava TaxID=2957203 RepID=UPI003D7C336C|nr:aspartate--tRNA ligase [Acidimicrobiia bacterium EGI L10123]
MTEILSTGPAVGLRTHWCGELRASDIGATVSLCGWVENRREHGEQLAFIDLRDRTGITQCVVAKAHDLRSEYVLRITGTVQARFEGATNDKLDTGEIELQDCTVEVLSTSEPAPFPIHERTEVDETIRLRHRYLDLRRARLQKNLQVRTIVNAAIRRTFIDNGFVEVETPMLIASTPEGARDFVVPSRLHPGSFYALPQSPQLYKQLCMVGGVDRYFQIARCLRDEDLRADRQFEFTQLDMECSFVGQEEVLDFVTQSVRAAVSDITGEDIGDVPRMTWEEAMERYGSDKPDTRFGMELVELTEVFADTEANVFKAPCVKGIRLEGGAELTRKQIDGLVDRAKLWGAKGLAWMRVVAGERQAPALEGGVAKFLSETESAATITALDAAPGDMVFLVADERPVARHVLGLLRVDLGKPPMDEGSLEFLWVTDFPMFDDELGPDGRPQAMHHPFTMPNAEDLEAGLIESDPTKVRSVAYDLVCNGWELGSGSVRIHRSDVQQRVFDALGIAQEEAQEKFGFLLDAFRFGPPPHAGFAYGIDRLVALLAGETNIREVIAFPKTQKGADPLTDAPSELEPRVLEELGLRVLPRLD